MVSINGGIVFMILNISGNKRCFISNNRRYRTMNNINRGFHGILFLLLGWSLIALLPNIVYSQTIVQKPVLEFAQESLEGYVNNVLNEKNFAKFNFKSLEEARKARLGDPYKVMFIGLEPLKNYKSGTGIRPLLMDTKTLWFPVMVGDEIRTQLEIREKKDKWVPGEFGRVRSVQEIVKVRNELPKLIQSKGLRAPYKLMLVRIPALYANFFYVESSQGEYLVPAMVQPQRYKLRNGQIYAADQALSNLREFAKEIDGKTLR
jgi:hypothetical protein